ncbi:MAG TPA: hypothetical protein VFS21_20615 [Roseiflexaceae bacterium]|nr:hypothetical protein [Roseiflexaceae bacterium]
MRHQQQTTPREESREPVQSASTAAGLLSQQDVLRLQRSIGNRAVGQLLGKPAPEAGVADQGRVQRVLGKRKRLIRLNQVEDTSFYQNYGNMINTGINGEQSGSDVEYVVGPRSGGYMGSGPKTSIMAQTITSLDTNLPTANGWIRGHLLNDWIGGSGKDNENLAPMSHTTNQQWNRNFEQRMKSITEVLDSFYVNNTSTDAFLLIGYIATASGTYAPATGHGITIPNQFDGSWYYGAYDRVTGNIDYGANAVTDAFNELDTTTDNRVTQLEGQIVPTTMQIH